MWWADEHRTNWKWEISRFWVKNRKTVDTFSQFPPLPLVHLAHLPCQHIYFRQTKEKKDKNQKERDKSNHQSIYCVIPLYQLSFIEDAESQKKKTMNQNSRIVERLSLRFACHKNTGIGFPPFPPMDGCVLMISLSCCSLSLHTRVTHEHSWYAY